MLSKYGDQGYEHHGQLEHNNMFATGKVILINSSILSSPYYYLVAHPIINYILNFTSKMTRDFFGLLVAVKVASY